MAYSGDVPRWDRLPQDGLPAGGSLSWYNMCIPNYARHKTNAEKLMNYYLTQGRRELDDYID